MKEYINGVVIVDDDFICVISFIVEPGKKLYYKGEDNLHIICCEDVRKAMLFARRSSAQDMIDHIRRLYHIDFSIERV